jgi:hypothetical protein
VTLNVTWLVNSAAHLYGYRPYDKNISPRENIMVSIVSLGKPAVHSMTTSSGLLTRVLSWEPEIPAKSVFKTTLHLRSSTVKLGVYYIGKNFRVMQQVLCKKERVKNNVNLLAISKTISKFHAY